MDFHKVRIGLSLDDKLHDAHNPDKQRMVVMSIKTSEDWVG